MKTEIFQKCYLNEEEGMYHQVDTVGKEKKFDVSDTTKFPKVQVEVVSVEKAQIVFELKENNSSKIDGVRFHLWEHKAPHRVWIFDMEEVAGEIGRYRVDFSGLEQEFHQPGKITLKGVLELCVDGKMELYRANGAMCIKNDRVYETISQTVIDDETYALYPYYSKSRDMNLAFAEDSVRLNDSIQSDLKSVHIRGKHLLIVCEVPLVQGATYKGMQLVYRSKLAEDADAYDFKVNEKQENEKLHLEARIDLSQVSWKMLYWDVKLCYEVNGQMYLAGVNLSKEWRRKFMAVTYNDEYVEGENFVYPYATLGMKLAIQFRKKEVYDDAKFKIKERVAFLYYQLNKKRLEKRNIYLVYEKFCVMAQDNGYHFFRYCMEHDVEKELDGEIYYVIDKNSPDREKLAKYEDHLIDFMSYKHITYLLGAKLLISTDTRSHAYAWRKRASILTGRISQKKIVFLQHGVTAFKRVDFLYGKGKSGGCDAFVVTSDYERDIVEKYFHYPLDEIAVTGFARWDVLEDKSEGKREVLLMPTWRNWLDEVDDATFMQSDYYKNYMHFLNSKRLKDILEKYDLKFNFYIHPKFREYIGDFQIEENDRLHLIPFGTQPLNELMMTCKMLITDYSSVAWDVYYQSKPVLFYHFDLERYEEAHGSYMDIKNDIFGERTEDVEELIDMIEDNAKNQFQLKPEYAAKRDYYFKYTDNDNSKRICEHIKKMKL